MFFWVAAATLLADQFSKALVQAAMSPGESIPVLPPYFYLTYIMNPGAAFGLFAHRRLLFVTVTVFFLAGIVFGYKKLISERVFTKYGLALVWGGALGNLIDRLAYGMVVDFLDFRVWPVFNLADTAIVSGACLLAFDLLRKALKNQE